MANSVYHVELGLVLDLRRPDLGYPELPNLWEQLRQARPIGPGVLECNDPHPEKCLRWMKLTERGDGLRFASHYAVGELREHAAKSDLHLATQEYIAASADKKGLPFDVELHRKGVRRVVDVRVGGPVPLACEVQVSYLHPTTIARRCAIDVENGDVPLWVVNDPYSPAINRAPWTRIDANAQPWRIRAGLDDLVQGGVMQTVAETCGLMGEQRCQLDPKRLPCGRKHLYFELIRRHLADVVVSAATGAFKPTIRRVGNTIHHIWLSADDYERYHDEQQGRQVEPKQEDAKSRFVRELDRNCRLGQDDGIRTAPARPRDSGMPIALGGKPVAPVHLDRCCGQRQVAWRDGPLVNACQLCPESPTYWRRSRQLEGPA